MFAASSTGSGLLPNVETRRSSRVDRRSRTGGTGIGASVLVGVVVLVAVVVTITITGTTESGIVGPGLLGVAAGGPGREDAVERLAGAVEEFVDRLDDEAGPGAVTGGDADDRIEDTDGDVNEDVDLSLDRDDEVGRLSDAIDELATMVQERERESEESERYRKELYRITSATETTHEEKLRRLLELGCERLGCETGVVTRIDEATDRYEIRTVHGTEFVQEGDETSLLKTFCRETVTSDDVLGIYDAVSEGRADDPGHTAWEIGCYVGGKIEVGDELYGTLCFVNREPREEPFTAAERTFVDLTSRWLSHEFERRERERELGRQQAFTDDILDAVDDVVYVLDADGELRRWNESVVDVTGYTDAELDGMYASEFFDAASQDAIADELATVIETGHSRLEATTVTKEGDRIPYEYVASTLEDPDGNPIIVGIGRDISERKARERELEEYKSFTDDMLDALDDVFYVLDADGELRRWNEALAEVTGYSHAEIEAMTEPEYFGEDVRPVIQASVEEAFETGDTRIEVPLTTSDGDRIPYEFVASVLEGPDGKPVEVGIGRDISERKRYERDLERTTHRLEQTQRLANVGAWELDVREEPHELRISDETARIHGLEPEADVDLEQAIEFYHPEDRPRIRRALETAIEDGTPYDHELRLQTAQGEHRWVRTIGEPISDNGEIVGLRGSFQDITERKTREQKLRETTERLEAIIEATPAAIVAFDTDGRIERWNPAAESIFGWTEDDVLGERPPYVPDDRLEEFERFRERLHDGESLTGIETQRVTIDGDLIDVSVSAAPMYDADGEIIGIMAVLEDISDRKERERELQKTNETLNAIVEASPAALIALESDGRVQLWNPAAERIFGWTEDEVLGEPLPTVPDERTTDHRRLRDDVLDGEAYAAVETKRKRKDGELIDVSLSKAPMRDADGNVIGVMGAMEDITERKKHKRDLQETKHRLELALESADAGIWEWTIGTDEIVWNETLERLLGLEPGGFEGTYADFKRRVHPDDIDRVETALEQAVEHDELYQAEFRMQHPDDRWMWFAARGRLVADEDGERMLGIVNDVTKRKEQERRLRERERELQRYREYTDDVLDAIDDVFYVLDEEYDLQRWNASLAETTGYTDDELDGTNAFELIAESDREAVRRGLDTIDDVRGVPLEADVLTKDGERIPFEFVAAPLEDPDGTPVIAGIGRDVSDRVETERQFSRLISNIPGLVYRVKNEPEWPTEFVSDGVRDVTGYTPEAFESGDVSWGAVVDQGERTWDEVQDALEAGDSFNLVYPLETADGERRWVREQGRGVYADDGSIEAIEGVITDITERIEYERELERTTDLLERVQRMAKVGGWEFDIESEPWTAIWTEELYRLHELPRDVTPDLETTIACYHPDDRSFVRDQLETAIATETGYEYEARLRTDGDDVRWVQAMGEPIYDDGELVTYRGTVQDVTQQKRRELALESLHETARSLLNAETESVAADRVVDTAAALLDSGSAAIYLLDAETNRFEPVALTDDFDERTGGAPSVAVGDGDSVLWNTYVTGTQTVVDNGAAGHPSPLFGDEDAGGLLVPIGDHGVFVLLAPAPAIDDETRQLFETLVATTEAAFDRLESEASLRERDAKLEAQNRRLRRQISINDIIRRIDRSLIGTESRAEIEHTVPERLVESADVAFAWIGAVDSSETTLEPRAWAGAGEEYLDDVSLALEANGNSDGGTDVLGAEPAVRTARTGTPTVVENVVDGLQRETWRSTALNEGFQSVVSVPLAVEEYTYGVLTVYADEPDAFTDLERTVFTELGEGIANAINAVKTQEALHAETLVELTLELEDADDLLSRIARATGARVTYEGLATESEGTAVLFFETTGANPEAVRATLDDRVTVTDYRVIREADGNCLFEATVSGDVLVSRLVRHGGSPRSIVAEGTEMTVTVDVPTGTDVREFVELLDEYDGDGSAELRSQRHVERTTHTRAELVSSLFEPLTERQREVLRTAYLAGFFEWPRESTGEEIADMLDVTQPTVNRHLRIGQQRLLEQLFEDESLALAGE